MEDNLMPKRIPLDEVKKLAEESMQENILILQALADQDRKDTTRPWKAGVFVLNPLSEFTASVGTGSGMIQMPTEGSNYPTVHMRSWPVEKLQSVST
jgi:hypothetical protein